MAIVTIKNFGGISPRTPARYLQDSQAQVAINCPVFTGPLVALNGVSTNSVVALTNPGATYSTIYRYGQDPKQADGLYWFAWDKDVDIARGQIPTDPVEWTFYTGDNYPKATYNSLALSSAPYPANSIPLGIPNPSSALYATPDREFDTTEEFPAVLVLDAVALENLTTLGCQISIDGGSTFTTVALNVPYTPSGGTAIPTLPANNRAVYVAGRIDTVFTDTQLLVENDNLEVTLTTFAKGKDVKIIFKALQTSTTEFDTTAPFEYSVLPNPFDIASGLKQPRFYIKSNMWKIINQNVPSANKYSKIVIKATSPTSKDEVTLVNATTNTVFTTATQFQDFILENWIRPPTSTSPRTLDVLTIGTTVILQPNNTNYGRTVGGAGGFSGKISVFIDKPDETEKGLALSYSGDVNQFAASGVYLSLEDFNQYIKGKFVSITVNGKETIKKIDDNQTINFPLPAGCIPETVTDDGSAIFIKTEQTNGSSIRLRAGTYPASSVNAFDTLSAQGGANELSIAETRVYTYTWVNKVAERDFESGPAAASAAVDVYDNQKVILSKFQQATLNNTDGYYYVDNIHKVTSKRIYRSVSGTYLLVAEIPASTNEYIDKIKPEALGEEMVSLGWGPPNPNMTGLINLPNGMMAAFFERDIFFCQPYYSHAWPEAYTQTVDYPVVGLGRMDTTLVALTTGVPYFIQGSHPDSMVVVKSDIQQACASKRSIVSISGVVIYASPDGLVMLSSGGSRVITENMFTRAQWQTLVPSSIHAYQHDSKYIAFYNTGATQGGFIYDLISQQFIHHNIYATAGFNDLLFDHLYLAMPDNTVKRWLEGSLLTYTWRSKIFSSSQIISFSCAQVEAETYPGVGDVALTVKFYCDNSTTPFHTKTVTSRVPFRLPVKAGRDWEVQIEGNVQVFSVSIAQSMQELAGA